MRSLKYFFNDMVMMVLFLLFMGINLWMVFGKGGMIDIWNVSGGRIIPDLFFYQKYDHIHLMLSDYGPQGRLFYLKYQFRDFIYPLVYGAFFTGILIRLIKPKSFNLWVLFPWLTVFFDFAENYFIRVIFYDFPQIVESRVQIASWATSLKWIFFVSSIVLIIFALYRRRKKNERRAERYRRGIETE